MILDIVVDVQKDFITGALANPQAQANVAHLAETVKAHARAGHWLFLTRDTHPDNYLATREGRHLPVEHCIEGEDGWNFAPELENALDGTEPEVCHIVNKPSFGSYMLPSEILDELMAHNKAVDDIEKIVIYGYCTDICVISNAMVLRAAFPETEIEIIRSVGETVITSYPVSICVGGACLQPTAATRQPSNNSPCFILHTFLLIVLPIKIFDRGKGRLFSPQKTGHSV